MSKSSEATRSALIAAAAAAFDDVGFEQTNTNDIARRAGFAPQTFYRHFRDKLAIFIAVYEGWTLSELDAIASAASPEDLARQTWRHHTNTRLFRRTLRDLSVRNPDVAAARAASRLRQLEAIRLREPGFAKRSVTAQIGVLLAFERLCDAIVEGEFERLGAGQEEAIELLARLVRAATSDRSFKA